MLSTWDLRDEAYWKQSDRVAKGRNNKHLWSVPLSKETVPGTGVKERAWSCAALGS